MRGPPSISAASENSVDYPTYVQGRNHSELSAHFRSGATVQVELGRRRRYPGLECPAPLTHGCYRNFLELGLRAGHVVDVGCGSGIGLRLLKQATARVTGLDIDGKAIAFAREFEPEAELIHGDIRTRAVDLSGSIALIVDVLGLVTDPVHILRSVARRTSRLEFLFVAEPIAQCTQRLVAPARRAFSVPSLRSLFARSGFAIDQLIDLDDGMRCAIGHVMHEPASGYLLRAERAYLSHQTQLFLEACELVQRSSNSALRVEAALLEARLWFDLDRRDRAIAALSDARFLAPDDPRPLAGLSRLALASGSHAQAIRLAAEAVKADPTDFSATCSSALAHASGDPDRSFCAWETANALVPDDPAIVRLLCAAALAEGRYDEALLVIERLSQYGEKISQLDKHVGLAYLAATAAEASGRAAEIARATPGDGNEQAREPLEALLELSLSTLSTRPI